MKRRAHLWDYIEDRTSREAITRRTYSAGAGDCAPFLNAARLQGAAGCELPDGGIAIGSSVTLDNFEITGANGNSGALYPYATHGSVIEIRSPTVKPFLLGENWGLSRLAIFHPLQVDKVGGPDVYEPVLQPIDANTNVTGGNADRIAVINAYDFLTLGGNGAWAKAGQNNITNSRICALHDTYRLNHNPDWLNLTGTQHGGDLFGDMMLHYGGAGAGVSGLPFRDWFAANGTAFRIQGDSAHTDQSVDAPVLSPSVFYGYASVFLVEAWATLTGLTALGLIADGCQQLLKVCPNGAILDSVLGLGGNCYAYKWGSPTAATPPFVDIDNPRACSIKVEGRLAAASGPLWRVRGSGISQAQMDLSAGAFARTTTAGDYWAGEFDAPNAQVSARLMLQSDAASVGGITRHGVKLTSAKSSRLEVQADACQIPVQIDATAGAHSVHAITTNTGGTRSLIMADCSKVAWSGKMDKGPQMGAYAENAAAIPFAASNTALNCLGPIALEAGNWLVSAGCEITAGATVAALGYAMVSISNAAGVLSSSPALVDKGAGFNTALAWANGLTLHAGQALITLTAPGNVWIVAQAGYTPASGAVADQPLARASVTITRAP